MNCVGKYEYMPDDSWKGSGTKGGKLFNSWEEGSHLKEYTYKVTGGTDKFEGASGMARTSTTISRTLWLAAPTKVRSSCPERRGYKKGAPTEADPPTG